jgi:1-acyl-sn-glycerol-3-phosphate acyltransferase
VAYVAPPKQDVRYYGWWGDTNFFPHFFNVLGQLKQGRVTVTFHSPVKVADVVDRKALAKMTHATVAAGLTNTFDIC